MQGMVSAMTSAVCVALTMRMTMSVVPMSCAVALVWKPVSTSSPSGVRKTSPSAAILSMCALYLSTSQSSAPPLRR